MSIPQMEKKLGRTLNKKEKSMVKEYRMELTLNADLKNMYKHLKELNYYIPVLTDPYGNCFFESLLYYKVDKSITDIRKRVSATMEQYKEYKLPDNDRTVEQLFMDTNEIQTIKIKQKNTIKTIPYDYDEMCRDILRNGAWSRLPTQLILMVLSYVFKFNFIVMSDQTTYNILIKNNIDEESIYRSIRLGHISGSHYVPLDVKQTDGPFTELYYVNALNYLKNIMKKQKK